MFIWRIVGSYLKFDVWEERKKPIESRDIKKAFPAPDTSHHDFNCLFATNTPLTIELHLQIKHKLLGNEDKDYADPFERELEIRNVQNLGYCQEPE
jgi:hypothetical protein